jgi:hypothetical protein
VFEFGIRLYHHNLLLSDSRLYPARANGNPSLNTVKYWAKKGCKKFDLKGFRIFKSSKGSYHVVFDRSVSWKEFKL